MQSTRVGSCSLASGLECDIFLPALIFPSPCGTTEYIMGTSGVSADFVYIFRLATCLYSLVANLKWPFLNLITKCCFFNL